jgi:hypothetical protein
MAGTADLATSELAALAARSSVDRLAGLAPVGLRVAVGPAAVGPVEAAPAADAPEAAAAMATANTTKQINGPGACAPGPLAARPLLLALTFDPARST